jgi:soluble lytic murein transglycosylase-like protein
MKNLPLLLGLSIAALTFSARDFQPWRPKALPHPEQIVPPSILWGIARAESAFQPKAISLDGRDRGMFQLRMDYDRSRGVVDPYDPVEAVGHAVRILEANMDELGSWRLAIAAYKQGVRGVRENGPDRRYIDRVLGVLP